MALAKSLSTPSSPTPVDDISEAQEQFAVSKNVGGRETRRGAYVESEMIAAQSEKENEKLGRIQ